MPMVTLREISVDNFEECLSLSVAEDQKKHTLRPMPTA